MDSQKIICYANLNSFNSPKGVTDSHMQQFFNSYYQESNAEIVAVFVDHSRDTTTLQNREGWKKLKQICKEQKVDCIVVPSLKMLGGAINDLINLSKEFDYKYGTSFYIMHEDIGGSDDRFRLLLDYHATLMYEQDLLKKNELKMREKFYNATGLNGEQSAVPVLIDYDLYHAAEAKAKEFGDSVDALVHYHLQFASDPANKAIVEKHVYGIEQPKSKRGRPKKTA